jgi:hypothetical protein
VNGFDSAIAPVRILEIGSYEASSTWFQIPAPIEYERLSEGVIDWAIRDNVRAQLRVLVKRILRKYGYPPDKQEKATRLVLEQAEVLSEGWA